MNSKFYSKLLDYIESHNSLCSLDFNEVGFEKHTEALVFLKSLKSFGDIFVVNEVKRSCWCLTDKGKEFIRNYKTNKKDEFENVHNSHINDALFNTLVNIEEKIINSIEDNLLQKCKEQEYTKDSELNCLEVTKGDGFENKLQLASDVTVDMVTSKSWKDVVLSSYDYNKKGNIEKFGSFHVVYDFITAVRHALFELGFREVAVPSFIEKYSNNSYVMETLQDEFDSIYHVKLRENTYLNDEKTLHEDVDLNNNHYLRSNIFHGLLSEICSLKSVPSKLYAIGKVFQNKDFDSVDIPEFHALEIIMSDSDLDLSNVLGICFALFTRLNIVYTDFKQAYFPYTSPTIGIYMYNEILDAWNYVGEGGIVRPEFSKKLGFNETATILRLGFSLERILMNKKEIDNIRHLL